MVSNLRRSLVRTVLCTTVFFALLGPELSISKGLSYFRCLFFLLVFAILFLYRKDLVHKFSAVQSKIIRGFLIFCGCWLGYGLLSLSWTVSFSAGVNYLGRLSMMLLLVFCLLAVVKSKQDFNKIACFLLGGFSVVILFGFIESITLRHLSVSRAYGTDLLTVTSFFRNENDLATFLTIGLPFLLVALVQPMLKRRTRFFFYLLAVLSLYLLILTGSRSNVWLVLPLIIIGALFSLCFRKIKVRQLAKNFVLYASMLGAVQLLFLSCANPHLTNRALGKLGAAVIFYQAVTDSPWGLDDDLEVGEGRCESGQVRKYLLLNGWHFLKESSFKGVGVGSIELLMATAPKVNVTNIHNWWAEILVTFGVGIFAIYFWLYSYLLWRLFKMGLVGDGIGLALFLSLGGLTIGCMAPSSVLQYAPMWILFGLALAYTNFEVLPENRQLAQ
ncbi:MAG: hypothetical protein RLZ12_1033 [Bacillota bacterium]|jgi:hypothetical protein